MSKNYGVLIDDEKDGDCGVSLRGTFIIDKSGKVRVEVVNDLPIGRDIDELLRLVSAIEHSDSNPDEGCPAGWKKGKKNY